jgi:hypothetical protein
MRRVIDRVLSRPSRLRDEERGATAVIVVLTLIALCGMIVLTVDVGQLLFKRRAMVNASDAAALAAAQSCAGLSDSDSPEAMADVFALDNVTAPNSSAANIIDVVGCDGPPFGHVTVEYSSQQNLFFAGSSASTGPPPFARRRRQAGVPPAAPTRCRSWCTPVSHRATATSRKGSARVSRATCGTTTICSRALRSGS